MPAKYSSSQSLCEALGYTFSQPGLLERALTHRSYSAQHNERLEFLGDSILNFVIAEALYHHHSKAPEGDLSRLRSHLVQGETLGEIAKTLHLGKFLRLGYGELKTGGNKRTSILADALEAIIAAIFLDSGLEAAKQCILHLFKERLHQASPSLNTRDSKTQLQEYLQSKKYTLPLYEVVSTPTELHQQIFKIRCSVKNIDYTAFGTGASRRKAEQIAATDFLKHLKQK